MSLTVLDSKDLAGIIADANGEAPETKAAEAKPAEKPADNTENKAEAPDTAAAAEDDADDVEGDDGLTPRQKRELSAKMLKAIGKKHRLVKEAEEFAADQISKRREAEARAAEAEERARRLEAANKPAAKEQKEPKREDFSTESEYIDARVQWGVDEGIRKREAERITAERQASMQWQFSRAAELVPDFERTVSKPMDWPEGVVEYLQESEMFAELGYHFGKNPDELKKLGEMSLTKRLVALGKIEVTLTPFGKPAQATPKDGDKPSIAPDAKADKAPASTTDTGFTPSKARSDPAPVIRPLSSSDGASVETDPRERTTREEIAAFVKRKQSALTSRQRH